MPRRQLCLAVLAATLTALLGASGARAAAGGGLAADVVAVDACTGAGVGVDFVVAAGRVTAVDLVGLPQRCLGQSARVDLVAGGAPVMVSGAVTGATTRLPVPQLLQVSDVVHVGVSVSAS